MTTAQSMCVESTTTASSILSSWIVDNWKWLVNILLLLITILLGIRSYMFQKRTNLRQSLDYIDDMEISADEKLKPVLYKVSLLPFFRKTQISIQRFVRSEIEGANILSSTSDWMEENDVDLEQISKIKNVSDIKLQKENGEDMILTVDSVNGVICRRTLLSVFKEIRNQKEEREAAP